ncbi:alpha/beta fold hydrolase [Bacillus massilinigeriensis]|uniref:alpha/beta fold hydrolase n=1 Tax=Bacillus mediterraneensis TaxID=1805474 RepID=UPI000A66D542|nr:alpha/beta hydrolase [Bacillus mediterraneensis]
MEILHHKIFSHSASKEWVVLVHGIGGSSSIWFKQIKEYRKHFNLLLVDLPGHGGNKTGLKDMEHQSFEAIADRVTDLLDHLGIKQAHFVGVSLGTLVIRYIARFSPERVASMVLGGSVERIHPPLVLLAKLVEGIKHFIPYMWVYRLVAWILMPKEHHAEARKTFIREAIKLGQREFFCWYRVLHMEVNKLFTHEKEQHPVPSIYIMGSEDYMFLPYIKKRYGGDKNISLSILSNTGHVCNIEKDKEFNDISIAFIKEQDNRLNEAING